MIKTFDFLESEIPENILIKAEDLLDIGIISERKSHERNLLLFQCDDHEIEILVSPKYIKKYTCDCEEIKSNSICQHIAAALLLIRKQRTERQLKRKLKNANKKVVSKLTIDSIIDHIDPKILLSFIKQYARSNAKFDTAIKVNFARRVPVENIEQKYKSLLDKILKPLTGVNESYTTPSINYFVKHANELFEQYKDAISLESYVEATTIITLLLKKCAYASLHSKLIPDSLDQLNQALDSQIALLLNTGIAPELKEELSSKLLNILSLSYYCFPQIKNNVAYYLIQLADKDIQKKLHSILIERLSSVSDKAVYSDLCALIILNSQNIRADYSPIFTDLKTHHLQGIFEHLLQFNLNKSIYSFIDQCKNKQRLSGYSYQDVQILLARSEKSPEKLIPLLSNKFLHQKNKSTIQELLGYDKEQVEHHLLKIRRSIEANLSYSKVMLDIYVKLEDYDLMIDYVLKHDLYNNMTEYINLIYQFSPTLIELYIRKYKEKCVEDIFHAHRNQIYILRNVDKISDAAFSNKYLNELRAFKESLEQEEVE